MLRPGGDLAELGARAGGHHDTAAAAGVHDRAHQRAPGQFGQRRPDGVGPVVLSTGSDSPGQHRLVALQTADVKQPDVGRDDVTEPQLDQVAGHQLGDVDAWPAARRG